jgi:hypothetical protein
LGRLFASDHKTIVLGQTKNEDAAGLPAGDAVATGLAGRENGYQADDNNKGVP